MKAEASASLRRRLELDPDADLTSLVTSTDKTLSVGQDVWRLRWRDQITVAVAEDADLHTTCGALLDALAIIESLPIGREQLGDLSVLNLLIDRPMPDGETPSETAQAVRSLRDAVSGVHARVWYRRGDDGWAEDTNPAPIWAEDDPKVRRWLDDYLMPRLTAAPGGIAVQIVDAVGDPSLQLYPSSITRSSTATWALRVDGLQIGVAGVTKATLTIGAERKNGDGKQRAVFTKVFGRPAVTVADGTIEIPGALRVDEAVDGIRRLLRAFRSADVPGAPLTHRSSAGAPFVDEHTLEARLLKGLARLEGSDHQLVLDDDEVARGSQFPTLWGHGAKPRYLDAMLRRGRTPLAVELKVSTGGQGRYYRRSLIQAVLYAHFIRNAPGLEPWFLAGGLDRKATRPCIGVPIPARWTPGFRDDLELLKRVGAAVGVEVYLLDDRAAPEWDHSTDLAEPGRPLTEQLTWQLAAALTKRWPTALGRVVETHNGGGQYDEIRLQRTSDGSVDWPAPGPRVVLNRPGSLWVFSPTGSTRWVWRGIWNHLAAGGDIDAAADVIGAMAGLGSSDTEGDIPAFASLAARLFHDPGNADLEWRCAWTPESGGASWVDRYSKVLSRYSRSSPLGELPTIARIWGAVRNGEAEMIVDQSNLRVWVGIERRCIEIAEVDPLERMAAAAATLG